jgi:hypothetical protein
MERAIGDKGCGFSRYSRFEIEKELLELARKLLKYRTSDKIQIAFAPHFNGLEFEIAA